MDAKCRTKLSFINKETPDHHLLGPDSILLEIRNFNIINSVVLDYMHLLCVGVRENIICKWLKGRNPCRLPNQKQQMLIKLLKDVTPYVPCEFQRKVFDVDNLSDWKATQFRFSLFYYGGLLSYYVMDTNQHKHFMLLFISCRILSHEILSRNPQMIDIAEMYLRSFFLLLPTYYGRGAQSMNFHNLIHLVDDVRYMDAPISYFSSFPFENFLSQLK